MSGIIANQSGSQISDGRRQGASKRKKALVKTKAFFLLKVF